MADIIEQLQSFLPGRRPMTIEFSYYPYSVGLSQKQEVFWEWRSGSFHDMDRIIGYFLKQSQSHELVIQLSSDLPLKSGSQ